MYEPQRYSPKLLLTFNNGLLQRGDDSTPGFVSNIHNYKVEADKISRRRGSKNLLPNDESQHIWKLDNTGWAEIEVSGSRFLITVDANNKVYAIHEQYPQVLFEVYAKIRCTTPEPIEFYNNPGKFYSIDSSNFFFIISQRGEAYRIDKNGKIDWFYDTKISYNNFFGNEGEDLLEDIPYTSATYSDYIAKGRVILCATRATNKEYEDFCVLRNDRHDTQPITGDIRIAAVNDCNVISKWSRPIHINKYKHAYISRYPGISINNTDYQLNYIGSYTNAESLIYQGSDYLFVGYDGASDYNDASIAATFIGDPDETKTAEKNIFAYTDGRKFLSDGLSDFTPANTFEKNQLYKMNFHFCSIINDDYQYPDKKPFVKWKDPLSDKTISLSLNESKLGIEVFVKGLVDNKYEIVVPDYYGIKGNALMKNPNEYHGYNGWTIILYESLGCINRVYGKKKGIDVSSDHTIFKHNAIDCWNIIEKADSFNIADYSYDFMNMELYNTRDYSANDAVALMSNYGTETILNRMKDDDRFAIWQDDKSVLISQLAFMQDNDFVYKIASDSVAVANPSFDLAACPVMSLHFKTLREIRPYELSEAQDIIRNLTSKPVISSNNTVFINDSNSLYISDLTLMLKAKIEINGSVKEIYPFYDGCLAFTSSGVYRVTETGKVLCVQGGKKIKAAAGILGSIVAVNEDDTVYYYSIYYDAGGTPTVKCDDIGAAIYDVKFGNNISIAVAKETVYISNEKEIYGFSVKQSGISGWTERLCFDYEIQSISSYNNELIVFFGENINPVETTQTINLGGG